MSLPLLPCTKFHNYMALTQEQSLKLLDSHLQIHKNNFSYRRSSEEMSLRLGQCFCSPDKLSYLKFMVFVDDFLYKQVNIGIVYQVLTASLWQWHALKSEAQKWASFLKIRMRKSGQNNQVYLLWRSPLFKLKIIHKGDECQMEGTSAFSFSLFPLTKLLQLCRSSVKK